MKKRYIIPRVIVVEIETISMMATSSGSVNPDDGMGTENKDYSGSGGAELNSFNVWDDEW
ncbi:MAG: hypothetical protein NC388_00500 [Clostridium sp.]|nr:hypothetical protein [Clostridium sp.]